jgi:CRP-like cAMP-binding protein
MPSSLLEFLKTVTIPVQKHIVRDSYIFQQGDPALFLYGIAIGSIRMVRTNEAGGEIVIYRAGIGETFAEAALFGNFFHCGVVAETDCELLLFNKGRILAAMDEDPRILRQYSMLLSRQVRDLRAMLEIHSIRSADERVMHYLRLHAGEDGHCHLELPLKDLAGQLGLAHETLYRSLKKLEECQTIRRHGRDIVVV